MSRVEIPSENQLGPLPTVLFGDPAVTKKGVVVVQEWWGMNQQIQDEAKQISEEGSFVTIVPDLYRGKVRLRDISSCERWCHHFGLCMLDGVFCKGDEERDFKEGYKRIADK